MPLKLMAMLLTLFAMILIGQPIRGQERPKPASAPGDTTFQVTPNDSLISVFFSRRQEFVQRVLNQYISQRASQSLGFNVYANGKKPILFFPDSLKFYTGRDYDYVGEELQRRWSDVPPVLDFGAMLRTGIGLLNKKNNKGKGTRKKRIHELPTPSRAEIHILTTLWTAGKISGPQIYARLDTSVNITAEMLWNLLHKMARNGFVQEKIISPQNVFNIVTPIGIFPVEVSGKNRRNRVYEYTPLVDRKELLEVLEARRYVLNTRSATTDAARQKQEIEKLIRLLVSLQAKSSQDADYN